MIIHSITPVEFLTPQAEMPACQIRPFSGGYLSGQPTSEGFMVSQVISTDPKVYLDKHLAPGQVLRLPPDSRQF